MADADPLMDVLLPRLPNAKVAGQTIVAPCPNPGHGGGSGDRNPSFKAARGTTQPVVLICYAGCSPDDILASVGLTWADVGGKDNGHKRQTSRFKREEIIAEYDYVDESGKRLYQVCRTPGKQFPQRVPDSGSPDGWRWGLPSNVRRVLYRLPRVLAAARAGQVIYVVEGEKDVHAAERAGAVATCNSGGAGKFRPEHAKALAGAIVRIVADRDAAGRDHARKVASMLTGLAAAVEICEATEGKDLTDHLEAGHTLAELAITWQPDAGSVTELAQDLHEFLASNDPAEDWVIPGLLERGDRLILTGWEGAGKSMLIHQLAVAAAAGLPVFSGVPYTPAPVLYIDCENPRRVSRRYFAMMRDVTERSGARVPDGGLRIIHRPEGADFTRDDDSAWLAERVFAHKPHLLILGPLYKLHATDINEEQSARALIQAVDAARSVTQCAVVIEAHAGHGDSGGRRPVRPAGSSLLLRWPEFGMGLRSKGDQDARDAREAELVAWRGPRMEREWPRTLAHGQVPVTWPWVKSEGNGQLGRN